MKLNEAGDVSLAYNQHARTISPSRNVQSEALLEFESMDEASDQTLEEISMVLSGRRRDTRRKMPRDYQSRRGERLIALFRRMQKEGGSDRIFGQQYSDAPDVRTAGQIIALAGSLAELPDSPRRRALREKMLMLMDEEGWEAALFGMLEMDNIDPETLCSMQRVFAQARDGDDVSLSSWFARIASWPDRRRRSGYLVRMTGMELSACVSGAQQRRLLAVLQRLRRLLLFLGLDDECLREEKLCHLERDSLLPLVIAMTEETWLYATWLRGRLSRLVSCARLQQRLLYYLEAQFCLLPEACFQDSTQREQIIAVLRELKASPQAS